MINFRKALLSLLSVSMMLAFIFAAKAQQKKPDIATLEEKLKAVNILKNTNSDSAFVVVSGLIKSAHLAGLPVQEAKGMLIKGVILYNEDKNKEAGALFNDALLLFRKAGDKIGMAKAYNNLGGAASAANDIGKALFYQQQALQIRQAINDPLLSSSYNMIGNIYLDKGNYPKAIDYYVKGMGISEKYDDKVGQASFLNNIALIYWKQQRLPEAFNLMSRCLELEKDLSDYRGMAGSLNNISGIRLEQNKPDEAVRYCREAIVIAEKVNFTKELARSYNVLGKIAVEKSNNYEALGYMEKALALRRSIGRNIDITKSLIEIASLYNTLGDYEKAETAGLEGLALAQKNGLLKEKESFYRILGEIYNKKGDWKLAYENSVKHDITKDSVFSESNSKIIFDLQTKYETVKKQNEIIVLSNQNNLKSLQLKTKELEINKNKLLITQQKQELTIGNLELNNRAQRIRNQLLSAEKKDQRIKTLHDQARIQNLELANRNFLIGLILTVAVTGAIIGYVLYYRYRNEQRSLLEKEIIRQQEIATKSLFEGEQNERIRLARDLHDSIGQMLSVVKMNLSTLQHELPGNRTTDGTLDLVDKTIGEVRAISHNLLPEALNFGLFSGLEEMADKINASGNTSVELMVPEEVRKHQFNKQSELSIYRIVQEVLNNMVKHADATRINLDVYSTPTGLIINIRDNGKGFDTEQIKTSKGLGWKNISARLNLLDGKMQIQSEKLTGTQIEITIPA